MEKEPSEIIDESEVTEDEMKSWFKSMDKDADGFISYSELKKFMNVLGEVSGKKISNTVCRGRIK